MKKFVSLALVILVMVSAFAGCSGSKEVDLNTVLADVNSVSSSTSELTEITDLEKLKAAYNINEEDVKQFAAEYTADTSKAPVEIVVVEAKDKSAAENVKACLDARFQTIYSQYSSYSPEQFDMVKKCQVIAKGNFVTMVVSEDYDNIMKVINEAIG